MSELPFRHRAIAFLRDHMNVVTTLLPQSRIEDEHGNARFDAALVDTRIASKLSMLALWTFLLAAVLGMIAQRPLQGPAREATNIAAPVTTVAATAMVGAAIVARRRGTQPLSIELRGDGPVDASTMPAADPNTPRRTPWIVAAHGFTPDALAKAADRGVRCFAADGETFVERSI